MAHLRLMTGGAVAALVMTMMGVSEARAAIVATGTFNSDHCTGGCLTDQTNGGTITVTDDEAGTLTFNIQLANGNQFINTGFDATFGFNLTGNPSITYSNVAPPLGVSYTIPGGNPQSAGNLHIDGTGFFEYGLEGIGSGGSDPLGSSLAFSISAVGLDITDLDPNALGQFFAGDILSGTTGNTGAIDVSVRPTPTQQCTNPPCTSVPEPGSLALLGSGITSLGVVGGFLWWRRRDDCNTLAS